MPYIRNAISGPVRILSCFAAAMASNFGNFCFSSRQPSLSNSDFFSSSFRKRNYSIHKKPYVTYIPQDILLYINHKKQTRFVKIYVCGIYVYTNPSFYQLRPHLLLKVLWLYPMYITNVFEFGSYPFQKKQ